MVVGFAALHGISKSKIALALCAYASIYEVVFIVSGTFKNEQVVQMRDAERDPQTVWLKEAMDRASSTYQNVKANFENPNSKVHKNNWYEKNYLNPAWEVYSNTQKAYSEQSIQLNQLTAQWDFSGLIKILYRLGLVFLCMMLVHRLVRFKYAPPA